jgi:uncharacterized protein (TIGR02266 family)
MTQPPFDYSNIPRDSRRVPLATKVAFKFERFSGFISEFSANISPTGMYITTKTPEPPGSMLDFEFRLGDGFEIIQGKGEVVWTRAIAEGPNRPPGMGIRFLELGEGSKELIYRIVDQYIQDGGTPFDVSLRPPDPVPLPVTTPAAPPPSPLPAPIAAARPAPAAVPAASAAPIPIAFPEPPPRPPAASVPPFAAAPAPLFPELPDPGGLPPPVDSSSWLPPADGLEPSRLDDDFPPFMAPLPPLDEPEPVRPTLTFGGLGGFGGASAPEKKSRVLPLALAGLVLALAAAGYLFRETLMEMVGMGGGEAVAAAAPAGPPERPPVRQQAPPPTPVSQEGTVIREEDETPLPEVVRRKEPEAATPAPVLPPATPAGPALTALEKVTFEQAFGGTDIILQGNGAIRPESYEDSRMGDPPRELIRLFGIARGYPVPKVDVGTDEVKQVRLGLHENHELYVVIDLAGPGVKVTRVEAKDNQLRIHLQRQ